MCVFENAILLLQNRSVLARRLRGFKNTHYTRLRWLNACFFDSLCLTRA